MAVSITWSETNGGSAISSVDFSSGAAGVTLGPETIFLQHNANNPLTGCRFYLGGTDVTEMIEQGDAGGTSFGGVQIHMNAIGDFPVADWPTVTDKSPSGKDTHTFRTGFGDSSANGIMLAKNMGLTNHGVFQDGDSPDISFQVRIVIPSAESTTGARSIQQRMRFTYTS